MLLTLSKLKVWRKKYKEVDGTILIKQVAGEFVDEFDLHNLKGAQVFSLLRDDWNMVIPLLDTIRYAPGAAAGRNGNATTKEY